MMIYIHKSGKVKRDPNELHSSLLLCVLFFLCLDALFLDPHTCLIYMREGGGSMVLVECEVNERNKTMVSRSSVTVRPFATTLI